MGSLQLDKSSWEVTTLDIMLKLIAYSCLLAAVALAAPSGKELTVKIPKCSVTFEEIESESCIPKAEKVCDTKDVEQAVVKIDKECKDVTTKGTLRLSDRLLVVPLATPLSRLTAVK